MKASRHSPGLVLAVLGVLALYAYVFTHAGPLVGLPAPQALAAQAGWRPQDVFDKGGSVSSSLWMSRAHEFADNDHEMLAFYVLLAAAFLAVYFLPARHKRPAVTAATMAMVAVLYNWKGLLGLLAGHGLAYLALHPPRLLRPVMGRPRLGPCLRFCAVHSLVLTVILGSLLAWKMGRSWDLPLGLLLFFGQWMRLILYDVDARAGLVPENMGFGRYLENFLVPGIIPNWFSAIESQGYANTQEVYLRRDKNDIAWGGVRLLLLGLVFMAFGDWFTYRLADLAESFGVAHHWGSLRVLSRRFHDGAALSPASVLVTSLLNLFKFTFFWGGVSHFKIGVWRLFGFDMASNFTWWAASTDLQTLWARYTYHYREFLVRAFYYPVFFALPRWPTRLRLGAAILAAAGIGNMVWGHGGGRVFYHGLAGEHLFFFVRRWPYFALLSLGIWLTQLYQLGRPRSRKPWTWDRWVLKDAACAALTIEFYALLHVFAHPADEATSGDLWRIFLLGLGIRL